MCGEQRVILMQKTGNSGSPPRVRGTVCWKRRTPRTLRITPACAGNSMLEKKDTTYAKDHPRVCGEQGSPLHSLPPGMGSPPRVRGTDARPVTGLRDTGITPACAGNSQVPSQPPSPHEDHPRVCGEQTPDRSPVCGIPGSPPRVRGPVSVPPVYQKGGRITPACAGNSDASIAYDGGLEDHPRVCGEQLASKLLMVLFKGSPPRVRGTVCRRKQNGKHWRITPACAGNSPRSRKPVAARQDHPRVCGEQRDRRTRPGWHYGSPPRVRGTGSGGFCTKSEQRITPACAGNRCRCWPGSPPRRDHPRVCGEQQTGCGAERQGGGSPPRVRGTGVDNSCSLICSRITPACAGNRRRTAPYCYPYKDHPRVCGEQMSPWEKARENIGSPPRVRGTAIRGSLPPCRRRITPACAGNRLVQHLLHASGEDHPRVCGEQASPTALPPASVGSPPRVRGTVRTVPNSGLSKRITPACAGNSPVQISVLTAH